MSLAGLLANQKVNHTWWPVMLGVVKRLSQACSELKTLELSPKERAGEQCEESQTSEDADFF